MRTHSRVNSKMKITQRDKVLKAFKEANGEPVSTRYFKQQLLISEANGRISELRGMGYEIETLPEKDEYGFALHVLRSEPKRWVDKLVPVEENGRVVSWIKTRVLV